MTTRSIPSLLLSGLLLVLMSCSETPTGLDPADSNLYGAGIDSRVSLNAPQGRDVPLVRGRFRRQRVEVSINEGPPVEARFRGKFALTDSRTAPQRRRNGRLVVSNIGSSGQDGADSDGVGPEIVLMNLTGNIFLLCEAGKPVVILEGLVRRGRPSDPVPATVRIAQLNGESTAAGESLFDIFFEIEVPDAPPETLALVAEGQLVFRRDPCETGG